MKNIVCVSKIQYCHYCRMKGFFCETPLGGDHNTCPCCGKYDFLSTTSDEKYDFLYDNEYMNDVRQEYSYCNDCNIIFEVGCIHYCGGCTDNTYNCHFIKKWRDKPTNIEYQGMPQFEDENDWFENANNVEILQMYCPHKNDKCVKNRPDTYRYLHTCYLRNKKSDEY